VSVLVILTGTFWGFFIHAKPEMAFFGPPRMAGRDSFFFTIGIIPMRSRATRITLRFCPG